MKVFTFAAGMAAGYVLGSRAGRERYDQIVAGYQKVSSHPAVVQTREKATQLLTSGEPSAVTAPRRPDARPTIASTPNHFTDPIE
jgi:hypothetical protein